MKIVIAGPPRSGKSCFREGLKQAIRAIPGAPYPYVITGCPDGEGSWFQETVNRSPSDARACKEAYKTSFSPEFVERVSGDVRRCALPLVIIDIGGRTSPENEAICASATHLLVLAGDVSRFEEWRQFAAKLGLTVVAELHSDYHGVEDVRPSPSEDGVLRGSVHHLERGEPIQDRPTIKAIAAHLVAMVSSQ